MDSLDADAPDCLSKILLENSSTKSTPLPLLGRTGSARKGRRGHGSCRKQHPDPPEAHEGSGKGKKRQPSVQGHTSKGGKPAKSAAKSDPRDPGNRHGHGDKPPYRAGRGQSRGDPKGANGQHRRRERCQSVDANRTGHHRSSMTTPRRGSGSMSARASRADRSSDWNADKRSPRGSDTHRSNSSSKGSVHHFPCHGGGSRGGSRGLLRTPRRGGSYSERSSNGSEQRANDDGNPSFERKSPGKKPRDEAVGKGKRGGGGKPWRREPFASHNRNVYTRAASVH